MEKPIRVLIAKVGLDGHDRGAKVVAQALKDAGMEVIYSGLRNTPEQVVETALQEDVQVIGVSTLSGAHLYIIPPIAYMLKERKAEDILLICGGIIPEEDHAPLKEAGVAAIFRPGTPTQDIVKFIRDHV